ncbi:MAG: putative DNA binding domain-containing protein [Gammaproteobacteria bacterium]|nr:putative DNA binding domain-containing protein [Gammaproteobacteria bacterium]
MFDMITRVELLDILRNGENSTVEFKRDVIENHVLAKELVAFSNFEGGMVLLGVEDDGNVSGVTRDDVLEEWVMNACRDKIRPAIIPNYSVIRDVELDKDIAIVSVPRGGSVHSLWYNNRNTYFIRVGTQSREPTPEELGRLFQQRGMFRAELRPVAGSSLADLDRRRLKNYFVHIRQQDIPADNDEEEWQRLLFNTEIVGEDGVTLAGLLLFGRNPNRFLGQAGIDSAAYPSANKDYAARERSQLRGPIAPLLNEDGELVEAGLVEQALDFVRRNTGVQAVLEDGARRAEMPMYPPEVIREAVVNSVCHWDYMLVNTDIELSVYTDHIDIISLGRLPNGITPEHMRTGCRASRNQLIKDVMRDYGYLEHSGMGVPRKIIRGMNEHNGTDPELVENEERFIVRLHAN